MPDTFQSVLIGAVAGLVSAVITYFGTRAKVRLDLAAEYDKKLQEERLEVYKDLWAMMEPFARYSRDPVTLDVISDLSDKSRTWYFKTGGIYLTESSREPYFAWKRQLEKLMDEGDQAGDGKAGISDETLGALVNAGSRLRVALADDIGTKRLSRI